ncbi:MAG: C40 family peptidase, partial [Rhodocyclaceae bacterium]|nr:C40 family peptidase [Rhodocyclaceae bacterium]
AGLDCSGMVSYIVEQVSGKLLPHNAAQIAAMTRPVGVAELEPGDLVFFNTLNRRHSHMGIYIGRGQFIHAPSSRGSVRLERLDNSYFRPRIDGARRLVASR